MIKLKMSSSNLTNSIFSLLGLCLYILLSTVQSYKIDSYTIPFQINSIGSFPHNILNEFLISLKTVDLNKYEIDLQLLIGFTSKLGVMEDFTLYPNIHFYIKPFFTGNYFEVLDSTRKDPYINIKLKFNEKAQFGILKISYSTKNKNSKYPKDYKLIFESEITFLEPSNLNLKISTQNDDQEILSMNKTATIECLSLDESDNIPVKITTSHPIKIISSLTQTNGQIIKTFQPSSEDDKLKIVCSKSNEKVEKTIRVYRKLLNYEI